jgi:hypothetical protein
MSVKWQPTLKARSGPQKRGLHRRKRDRDVKTHAGAIGVRHVHEAMLATQLLCTKPSLMRFQYPDDLFFAEPACRLDLSAQLENRPALNPGLFSGAGHSPWHSPRQSQI